MKTKSEAEAKLTQKNRYSDNGFNCLKYGWNHSVFKQAAVSAMLNTNGYKYLIIFKDKTKLSPQAKKKMNQLNVQWCYESNYFA